MLSLRPYTLADASTWNRLVARSRNGNMLHLRDYMDYHAERFTDCSLIVERRGEPVAVFPANIVDGQVTSHAGLTYAGLIASPALRAEATLEAFERIGEHYRGLGANRLVYKAIPHVFHAYPAEEDLYALHRVGARITRRDLSSVIALRELDRFPAERKYTPGKALKAGIDYGSGSDPAQFHALLTSVLRRHEAVPTHSVAELRLLQSRFPDRIVLHEARCGDSLLAGTLVYDFGRTVHTQYMAVSDEGRQLDALSLLLAELIGHVYADRTWFSFGISTSHQGAVLNSGLAAQKEYFGGRAVVHDFYEWKL
ncbi:MAG TPA: GNAT family N-acetyltransferase [Dyella sp.]|uniref:GNAT family N-acetyltransferase n=1 Tax=Dyella sp. TaxID=1869338 RepID=UPI002F92DE2C